MEKLDSVVVHIWVASDEDANRISAILGPLGYTVYRELGADDDAGSRLRWAVNRLARCHKLTPREQDVLERVLAGRSSAEIEHDLGITRPTVKGHMHGIFTKTGTTTREQLLRLALQLPNGGLDADAGMVELLERTKGDDLDDAGRAEEERLMQTLPFGGSKPRGDRP